MILIGQYDSPFVRRVGIALTLYELPFEHRPWSTFGEADKLRPYNPLTRVPTLVLDNGESLIESHAILDYLDSLVPPEKALFPRDEPARHQALKIAARKTSSVLKLLIKPLSFKRTVAAPRPPRAYSVLRTIIGSLPCMTTLPARSSCAIFNAIIICSLNCSLGMSGEWVWTRKAVSQRLQ